MKRLTALALLLVLASCGSKAVAPSPTSITSTTRQQPATQALAATTPSTPQTSCVRRLTTLRAVLIELQHEYLVSDEMFSAAGTLHLEFAIHVPVSSELHHCSDSISDDDFRSIYFALHQPGTGLQSEPRIERFGFGYYQGAYDFLQEGESASDVASPMFGVHAPHWVVSILLVVLPARAGMKLRRRKGRLRCGRCLDCGYDLRATPDRCPECGAAPKTMGAKS